MDQKIQKKEIVDFPLDKLIPDPNQPRKTIDPSKVEEMAQSIKTEGLINPIEVDEKFVIVTGEMRWRACKEIELKKIHCKIIKINPRDRFRRQVIENVHHNSMTGWDTAKSFEKLLIIYSPGEQIRKPKKGITADKGIHWLAGQIGKSVGYISEHLEVLESSEQIKDAIKKGDIKLTFIRALKDTPDKYKKEMEKKILRKEFKTRDEWKEIFRKSERQFNILLVVTITLIIISVILRIIVILNS